MNKEISVIIPAYKPNPLLLNRLIKYLNNCDLKKDIEVIVINGKNGLANAYNEGIKKAKGDIIITIHSDCLPLEKKAINKMINPIKEDNLVVATYSKILQGDIQKIFYPHVPDGKCTAFKKDVLLKIGLFDEKTFFTGGEDVDIWLKLKKIGKIIPVDTVVLHNHPNYKGNRTIEKIKQNGTINGCLFRIWGIKNPHWLQAIIMCIIHPKTYGKYFVLAFKEKKQDYRRNDY